MIDAGLPDEWPGEVVAALGRFKQGQLVKTPPLFYIASARYGVWGLTRQTGDPDLPDELFELDEEQRSAYGLITTQTCDIAEKAPRQYPWIQIAPVYRLENANGGTLGLLRKDRISRFVLLRPPTLEEGPWVADLRIEVPVEKSWLVGRDAVDAYSTDAEYERLAQRLAGSRERPAIADPLVDTVVRPLRDWVRSREGTRAAATVNDIRLRIQGSRLEPAAAGLLVISSESPLPQDDLDAWERWWDGARRAAAGVSINLLPTEFETLDGISARVYVESVPLNLGYLSRD